MPDGDAVGGWAVTWPANTVYPNGDGAIISATASAVEIVGTRSSLTLGGSASSVKVRDHVGSLHGTLSMGSAAVVGVLDGPSGRPVRLP